MFDLAPVQLDAASRGWVAQLDLRAERRGDRTVLAHAHHRGPLRIQKALYPESPARADLLILHPPAGIAGGDELHIELRLEAGAQVRVTTPGAAKWYRSDGRIARQTTRLRVGNDAVLEWLPQEAIVFNGAVIQSELQIECRAGAKACGWDVWMLGRRAAGESFRVGHLQQRTRLLRDSQLLWQERAQLDAGDALRHSPLGWNGHNLIGTLWALGLPQDDSLLQACRDIDVAGVHLGVTRFPHGLWLARVLGASIEPVRTALIRLWSTMRPALCGAVATPPRIWAT